MLPPPNRILIDYLGGGKKNECCVISFSDKKNLLSSDYFINNIKLAMAFTVKGSWHNFGLCPPVCRAH